jgi:Xylose isomerase-like TIM barrel
VDSAGKGRRLLDQMRSPRLKVIMDAANLFDAEDPARRLSRSEEILDEAFGLLGGDLVLAHAKDVKWSGEVVAAGKGDLDYDLYLRHLSEAGCAGPLVLHSLAEEEVAGSLAFLREKLVGPLWSADLLDVGAALDRLTGLAWTRESQKTMQSAQPSKKDARIRGSGGRWSAGNPMKQLAAHGLLYPLSSPLTLDRRTYCNRASTG